ncbi:MAG: hypothetical protein KAU16_02500, partial [Methanophagales archaeon]|nr:hypothetical protein [Methanophagales archaeon]
MRGTDTKANAELELTVTEKRVLLALGEEGGEWNQRNLSEKTSINEDAVMQTAFMLAQKGLCEIKEETKAYYCLTDEGKEYAEKGLPERRALDFLIGSEGATVDVLKVYYRLAEEEKEYEVNIAINWLLKKKWARFEKKGEERLLMPTIVLEELPAGVDEEILKNIDKGETEWELLVNKVKKRFPLKEGEINGFLTQLISRNLLETYSRVERKLSITEAGKEILSQGISVEEEIAQLTPELLRTGSWRGRTFKRYDVNLPSKEAFPAKIHPYQRILDRMRRIFTEMGFIEIKGELVQSAFWNFD